MKVFSAPRLLVGDRLTGPASVVVEDGRVVRLGTAPPSVPAGAEHVQLGEGILTPGLVDLQVNGAFGIDLAVADTAGWAEVARGLARRGVTAYQPSFVTAPVRALRAALDRVTALRPALAAPGLARVLGVHLEGPFLSPVRAGAHDPTHMVAPTPAALGELLRGDGPDPTLTMVTIAPELPGAIEAVRRLRVCGVVVSVGHSDATAEQTAAAADAGATMVTHIFNAQRGLDHREPGVAGHALDDGRLHVGLIPDLRHVSASVCRLVMSAAAGRVALVSDATAAACMPPGRYTLGGRPIEVGPSGLPQAAEGAFAGSAVCLDEGVRRLAGAGLGLAAVLTAATRVPADALGRRDVGRLAPGAYADLVWWSDDLRVLRTWIGGEPCDGGAGPG